MTTPNIEPSQKEIAEHVRTVGAICVCKYCKAALARAAYISPERAKSRTAKPKKESRAKRWARLTNEAASLVDELTQLQSEFEEWRDNLPENFESSPLGDKLALICDLDLQGALETLQEAENTEPPLGFGRD